MSDFGTVLSIHRQDGKSTTDADEARVKSLTQQMVLPYDDRINDFSAFNLRYGSSSGPDGSDGILVSLTEYSFDDLDFESGQTDESLINEDRPFAERFGEELQEKLGPEYIVEVYCGHW